MERTDKVIVVFDCHVLEHKFSLSFACPVIPDDRVSDFFVVDEAPQENQVKFIHQAFLLLLNFFVGEETMIGLGGNLEDFFEVLMSIFFGILNRSYSDINVNFFPFLLELGDSHLFLFLLLSFFFKSPLFDNFIQLPPFLVLYHLIQLNFLFLLILLHLLQ